LMAHPETRKLLVYCDDREQLGAVSRALKGAKVTYVYYEGDMDEEERRAAANALERGVARCVLSMRCLDEGVDFPSVDGALVLASSKTKREFIQRRGRVLRRFPGKTHATIIDALVVPSDRPPQGEISSGLRALIRDELRRALIFSKPARNRPVVESQIFRIGSRFGLPKTEVETDYGVK